MAQYTLKICHYDFVSAEGYISRTYLVQFGLVTPKSAKDGVSPPFSILMLEKV